MSNGPALKPAKKVSVMPRKRAPHGVVTERPIALRLMPDELKQVQELAAAEKRPVANMCRLIVMQGIKAYRAQTVGA